MQFIRRRGMNDLAVKQVTTQSSSGNGYVGEYPSIAFVANFLALHRQSIVTQKAELTGSTPRQSRAYGKSQTVGILV